MVFSMPIPPSHEAKEQREEADASRSAYGGKNQNCLEHGF
jgi:hypothetical protein